MTKQQIKDDLKARGIFDKNLGGDPTWKEAFQVYFNETRVKLCTSCSGSYTRLRNWLNA